LPSTRLPSRHEATRSDVRWLLAAAAVFAATLLLLGLAIAVYQATGPHPGVRWLLKRLRFWARWLLPGV
jgi:hypothetical protein